MDISLHRVEKIEIEENVSIGKDENVSHYRQVFITVRAVSYTHLTLPTKA